MVKEITVKKLKKELYNNNIKLIDVRESMEVKICSIKKSNHIPMNEILTAIITLEKDKKYAIMCHSGIRSYNVALYLSEEGFDVFNVKGGIDEWARQIDKDMERY